MPVIKVFSECNWNHWCIWFSVQQTCYVR